MSNGLKKVNFCTSVREAIEAIGCSYVMALNVVNAELGNMKLKDKADDKTGDIKVKRPKSEDAQWSAMATLKPGAEKYETNKVTAAIIFGEWADLQAKAEKAFPSQKLVIGEGCSFFTWLKKVATPKTEHQTQQA